MYCFIRLKPVQINTRSSSQNLKSLPQKYAKLIVFAVFLLLLEIKLITTKGNIFRFINMVRTNLFHINVFIKYIHMSGGVIDCLLLENK